MAAAPQRGLVALFKRGWHEIPEVMASSVMGILGLGITALTGYMYLAKDGDNRKFKITYTVMRPDDPRAAKIRTGIDG